MIVGKRIGSGDWLRTYVVTAGHVISGLRSTGVGGIRFNLSGRPSPVFPLEQLHLPKLDLLQQSVIVIWRRQHNGSADAVVIAKLRERYGDLVCPTVIPHSSRVSEANEQHMTVREYAEVYGSRRDKGLHTLVDAYALLSDFVTSKVESVEAVAV